MKLNIDNFAGHLRLVWCKETSFDPEGWTPENPAYGQRLVSAMLVQEHLLGVRNCSIVKGSIRGNEHYWNYGFCGFCGEIDLTREQFGPEPHSTVVDHVLSEWEIAHALTDPYHNSLFDRYKLLQQRFALNVLSGRLVSVFEQTAW